MADSRFTSTALGAIRLAQENAARLGHSYVGSEHLLLALASQEYSLAARMLKEAGADGQTLRAAIAQLVGTGVPGRTLHQGLTPQCCQVIRQAAALEILEFMAGNPGVWGPTELARRLNLSPNLVFRVLAELQAMCDENIRQYGLIGDSVPETVPTAINAFERKENMI